MGKYKIATYNSLKDDLVGKGYNVSHVDDLPRTDDGVYLIHPSDGVCLEPTKQIIWLTTKNAKLGREVNKKLKSFGYYTKIILSRKEWLVVKVSTDYEKNGF